MGNQDISLYPYLPSKAAAIFAVVVFGLLTLIHIFNLFRTKTWFTIPFIIGLICKPYPNLSIIQSDPCQKSKL